LINQKKKESIDIESIPAEKEAVSKLAPSSKITHKLVLKDASDENPYTGRSNAVILGIRPYEEAKGNVGDTLEEIVEDNELSKEDEEFKDVFNEIIKLNPKFIEKNDLRQFVMK
jgi:hypothetical protein